MLSMTTFVPWDILWAMLVTDAKQPWASKTHAHEKRLAFPVD